MDSERNPLRNHIILMSEDTDVSAISEIKQGLEEYLPVLLGLTIKECGAIEAVQFKWRTIDGKQEICVSNSWFEVLSVVYMLAVLTLVEANTMFVPKHYTNSCNVVWISVFLTEKSKLKGVHFLPDHCCIRMQRSSNSCFAGFTSGKSNLYDGLILFAPSDDGLRQTGL